MKKVFTILGVIVLLASCVLILGWDRIHILSFRQNAEPISEEIFKQDSFVRLVDGHLELLNRAGESMERLNIAETVSWIYDYDSSSQRVLYGKIWHPALLYSEPGPATDLWVYDLKRREEKRITDNEVDTAQFDPQNREVIAYTTRNLAVWLNIQGKDILLSDRGGSFGWSFDASLLYYYDLSDGVDCFAEYNLHTQTKKCLLNDSSASNIVAMPDGKHILFTAAFGYEAALGYYSVEKNEVEAIFRDIPVPAGVLFALADNRHFVYRYYESEYEPNDQLVYYATIDDENRAKAELVGRGFLTRTTNGKIAFVTQDGIVREIFH